MSSLSGNRLYTRETNPPFRNKSQPLLPLREESVHSPKKLDLLSPSITGKRLISEKVHIPNQRNTFLTVVFLNEVNFAIRGATDHPRRPLFVLQVVTRLLSTGECHDDPLVLKIQVTTIGAVCGER